MNATSEPAPDPGGGAGAHPGALSAVDLFCLTEREELLRAAFRSADPFPHVVIDDFLRPAVARRAMAEFPRLDSAQWNSYVHANERKFSDTCSESWGPTLREVLSDLNSPLFVSFLERLTGIASLIPDETLEGGGLHQSVTGGFLNIHADFSVRPRHRNWERRVNLLLYLNEEWSPEWGGDLELWSADMQRCVGSIAPLANRVVVFATGPLSFHGHPDPMCCPPGVARRSLALYYFTAETAPVVRATRYRPRPGEGPRSLVIALDNLALRAYGSVKRRLGLSDRSTGRILRVLDVVRPARRGSRRTPQRR